MNTNDKTMSMETSRFAERIGKYKHAKEVTSDTTYSLDGTLSIPQKTMLILELK